MDKIYLSLQKITFKLHPKRHFAIFMGKILLIYTGGTIGMIKNQLTGALDPFNFEHLRKHLPELDDFDTEVMTVQFDSPVDSSDMSPQLWGNMVNIIADYYQKVDGFVILHGTDTMAYTASALSFMLTNIAKPVILTGSQLPIGVLRTDGKENIINAIEYASAHDQDGQPQIQEVAVCFGQKLLRGNRTTKCSADNFSAFTSYNCEPLAVSGVNIKYNQNLLLRHNPYLPFSPQSIMDPSVIAITLFPGVNPDIIRNVFALNNIKGIVLRTFGAGNAPRQNWLIEAINAATDNGKVVVNITQCQQGTVEMGLYATGSQLRNAGVVSGHDMTVEAAVTKLMFLFAQKLPPEQIRKLMEQPLAGELTI